MGEFASICPLTLNVTLFHNSLPADIYLNFLNEKVGYKKGRRKHKWKLYSSKVSREPHTGVELYIHTVLYLHLLRDHESLIKSVTASYSYGSEREGLITLSLLNEKSTFLPKS